MFLAFSTAQAQNKNWTHFRGKIAFTACTLRMVPSNLATDETLDIDWEVAFDANNGGSYKIHDFAQVSATNAAETVIVPGNESGRARCDPPGTCRA